MLKAIRIVAAAAVFVGLNLFFFGFAEESGCLAQIQFVPACLAFNFVVIGIVAGVTLLAGRIYCSVVCPLGIFQDVVLRLRRLFVRKDFAYRPGHPVLRAVFAAVFVVLALCGCAALAGLIEPYSMYGRFATHLFEPLAAMCANAAADLAAKWGRGRLFCDTVCPVGAVLGLLSAKAPFKIRLDASKCVKCGLCAKACKAECIDVAKGTVDQSRCVRCFNCLRTCKKEAMSWK